MTTLDRRDVPKARCGRSDAHGAHVIDRGEDGSIHGWCAGNRNVIEARVSPMVDPEQAAKDARWDR